MRVRPLGFGALELRNHVLVVKDRPRDQMREVGDEQRVMRQPVACDLAAIGVHQEGDLGEGVEGYPDRQQDMDRQAGGKQCIEVGGQETGIFEIAEHQEIAGDAEREHRKAWPGAQPPSDQQQADDIVEGDRPNQQGYELPVADGIEGQRRQRQPDHGRQVAEPAQHKIADQGDRQEQENELVGVEQHNYLSRRAGRKA